MTGPVAFFVAGVFDVSLLPGRVRAMAPEPAARAYSPIVTDPTGPPVRLVPRSKERISRSATGSVVLS